MKVRFDKEDKKYFTIAEAPIINAIIKDMKESEENINDDVGYAMHALDEYCTHNVLKAEAKICHNSRVWNYYNDESGTIDIWINATVETNDKFYIIGFCLSDAWNVCKDNHREIASHMYVRCFKEVV